MSGTRLASGGVIDRARPLSFSFEGRTLSGYAGDSLASALLANGERIVGRGFKYHRPRGVMSAGQEEGGALLTVGTGGRREPNVKAPMQPLYDGLAAFGQNAWPSVGFDLGRVNDLMGRFLSAGFYYKTFFGLRKGTKDWMLFEKLIRRAAGMGAASREADPDQYELAHAFCDVLVVGSGPAGLAAATQAARAGLDVVLAEQDFALGGALLSEQGGAARALEQVEALRALGVTLMRRTQVFGLYDSCVAGLVEQVSDAPDAHGVRQRLWIVRPRRVILATGALERPIAFGNNDRPGVMSAGAVRSYLNRFAVAPGSRAVVATTNASGHAAAADLAAAGIPVTLLDARDDGPEAPGGVELIRNAVPIEAEGRHGVRGLRYGRPGRDGCAAAIGALECDLIAASGGWSPAVHLLSHRGVKPVWNAALDAFLPGETAEPIHVCGGAAGVYGDPALSGAAAGAAAARALGADAPEIATPAPGWGADRPLCGLHEVRLRDRKLKSFVDPQHDVTTEDIRLAHREGFVSVEHMKRYTTLGMATDQGKMGNIVGLALMAEAAGKTIPETGTTTFRPPYAPVPIGALAARGVKQHFRPHRLTPLHDWNLRHGAVMTPAGLWSRPWYYPKPGETLDEAYVREMIAVREHVGLSDVSSLGKIMVQGPDAAEFLNRIYVNGFKKLPVGKARYGVMLRDDGIVYDDGTVWRLSETDYLMTATTANAAGVMAKLEEWLQTRWPELRVTVASVTDQWAGVAVAGPKARAVLEAVVEDCDVSNAALPFMGVRAARIGAAQVWIARISFSGELAYEVYARAGEAEPVADALWSAAQPLDGALYGLEALGALRIEKGHVAGSELDGRTTLEDLGLGGMASSKKAYIGKALAGRAGLRDPERARLVGVVPQVEGERLRAGAMLFPESGGRGHGIGWISAVTYSPEMGCWIGLGFAQGGLERWKDRPALACDPLRDGDTPVRIVSHHFLDPEGSRMHG